MDANTKNMIKGDFEKFFRYRLKHKLEIDIEVFVSFSTSLINFYQGSNLLTEELRAEGAAYLCQLFNAGLRQKINANDLRQIEDIVVEDRSLNYEDLTAIF